MTPRPPFKTRLFLVAWALASETTWAVTYDRGPSTAGEVTRSFIPREANAPETAVIHRQTSASLIAPIPLPILGGMFMLSGDLRRDERIYQTAQTSGNQIPTTGVVAPAPADNPLLRGGLTYVPHHQEGAPRYTVKIARLNRYQLPESVPPMMELTLGSSWAGQDLPFPITFSPRDQASLSLGLFYQRSGKVQRLIPSLGYRIRRGRWEADLAAPYHALLAWQTGNEAWRFYTGVVAQPQSDVALAKGDAALAILRTQNSVLSLEDTSEAMVKGWSQSWTLTNLVGMRRRLWEPLFVATEVGLQKEEHQVITLEGQRLSGLKTTWSPWARVALETWISTP